MERFLPKIHEALYNFRFMGKPYRKMHIFGKAIDNPSEICYYYQADLLQLILWCSQAVRHLTLTQALPGFESLHHNQAKSPTKVGLFS